MKVHILPDHDVYIPRFVNMTVGKKHKSATAWEIQIHEESIADMDMEYTDYNLYAA